MTATQQKLIDACTKYHMRNIEWERVEREGEQFPRHLKQIELAMEIAFIDIEVLSAQMVEEEQ